MRVVGSVIRTRERDFQHTVVVGGGDVVVDHGVGHDDPFGDPSAVPVSAGAGVFSHGGFALDAEDAVREANDEVVPLEARKIGHHEVLVVALVDVEVRIDAVVAARECARGRSVVTAARIEGRFAARSAIHPAARAVVHHRPAGLCEESEHRLEGVVAVCHNHLI